MIDSFPESVVRYSGQNAIVCIDVLTAGTTLTTSLAQGRRCFVARSRSAAEHLGATLATPLLVGECEGKPLEGFDLLDSPASVARAEPDRPLVLYSSEASELVASAGESSAETYVASLRNLSATARAVSSRGMSVAVIGAGYHSEFSCEDQFACAQLASLLLSLGYVLSDPRSMEIVRRWRDADPSLLAWGNSAAALRRSGRAEDLDFVLSHYDDASFACRYRRGGELVAEPAVETPLAPAEDRPSSTAVTLRGPV